MNGTLESAIESLRVKSGDPITAKLWNGLLDLVRELVGSFAKVMSGTGVRLQRYPRGLNIVADRGGAPFSGSFSVRLSGTEATVGAGTLEDITPRLDGNRIDGYDDNGKLGTIPKLRITGGPGEGLRSYVSVEVAVDQAGKLDPANREAVTITHRQSLVSDDDAVGVLPLAVLIWSDSSTLSKVRQIVYFDQRHRFIAPANGTAARHLFWPAS